MNTAAMKLLNLVVLIGCCGQATSSQCEAGVDLYFLIDSTTSLGKNGHDTMKRWAVNLVDNFVIGTSNSTDLTGLTRVEVIQFWGRLASIRNPDSHVEVDIQLGNYANKNDLDQKIRSLHYRNGLSTIIPHGLAELNREIQSHYDPLREIYAIVLTDGIDDSRPYNLGTINPRPGTLREEADRLKAKTNVVVFAIGFGELRDMNNLVTIASTEGNVVTAEDVGEALSKTYNRLITLLCPNTTLGSLQFQSCYDSTGCGGKELTGVSTAEECCLRNGLSFQIGAGICRQCIVHGFMENSTNLSVAEGDVQQVTISLDTKGNSLNRIVLTSISTFSFQITCLGGSNGGGLHTTNLNDFTATGCNQTVTLTRGSSNSSSEMRIIFQADNRIEGTEVLTVQLSLTSPSQDTVNNAGNIFFRNTSTIRVIDRTDVVIGFSEDFYKGHEENPNIPCRVTVVVAINILEIPLPIRLTPNAVTNLLCPVTVGVSARFSQAVSDFNATEIVTEIPAGETRWQQGIQIFDDDINEGREEFEVVLTVEGDFPVTYLIRTAVCRIPESDPIQIGFTQSTISHVEQNAQYHDAIINKSLVSEQTFIVQVETLFSGIGQSATPGEDFQLNGSVVVITPEQNSIPFSYRIVDDNTPENQEVFQLNVTSVPGSPPFGCDRTDGCFQQLEIVIQDNDAVVVGFERRTYTVREREEQVELCAKIRMPGQQDTGTVTFNLTVETQDASAVSNDDYMNMSANLGTFTNQQPRKCFSISIANDSILESTEDFTARLTLINSSVTTVSADQIIVKPAEATVKITDLLISVTFNEKAKNVSESDEVFQMTAVARFSQTSQTPPSFSLLVNTLDGTAIAPGDYDILSNFSLGPFDDRVRQLSFNVSIVDDNIPEEFEMFNVSLTLNPVDQDRSINSADQARIGDVVTLSSDLATITIWDNDVVVVQFEQPTYTVDEDVGQFEVCVVVTMPSQSGLLDSTFNLSLSTIPGSADTNDFTAIINQNVGPFSNAQRKQCFYVEITDDMTHEDSEHFFLNLTKHSRELQGVTIDLDVAEVTINDNDLPTTQLSTMVSNSSSPPTAVDDGVILGSALAVMVVLILFIGIAIIGVVYFRRKQHAKEVDLTRTDEMNLYNDVPKLFISSNSIRLLNVVGQGEFGVVYKAHLVKSMQQMPEIVAVKTLKGFFDQRSATDMMKESEKMQDFEHPHVLNITGVCVDAGSAPYIVMPFMANGSLLAYIKKEKMSLVIPNDTADEELVTVALKRLADMCIQIGKGMEYLASKKIVHRDLAARNCMIDAHFVIKVADFGLSENMYSKTYFRQEKDQGVKLPVKWLALEALTEWVFSEKSDVWSYGVTCWELFTGGRVPYPGVDPLSLPKLLESGHRLDKPNNAACSEEIYLFMLKCWHGDPEERPTFSELVSLMSQTLESLAGYMDVSTFGKLEVHGEDPHDEGTCDKGNNEEDPHDEGTCDKGNNEEDPHDEVTHGKNTHGEDPHCETEV